jgi:hypothetical protein
MAPRVCSRQLRVHSPRTGKGQDNAETLRRRSCARKCGYPPPPDNLYECQETGLTEWAVCKLLIPKEGDRRCESRCHKKKKRQNGCRTLKSTGLPKNIIPKKVERVKGILHRGPVSEYAGTRPQTATRRQARAIPDGLDTWPAKSSPRRQIRRDRADSGDKGLS